MLKTFLKTSAFGLGLTMGLAQTAVAADAPEVAATCVACHGERGAAPILPSYPVLAGQYADYLAVTLKAYRDGSRKNAIMAGIAGGLSDQDIQVLSRYFAQQEGPLYTPKVGP
jgi:cytochrome c553